MRFNIVSILVVLSAILVLSCEQQEVAKQEPSGFVPEITFDRAKGLPLEFSSSCGGSHSGNYGTINSYYIYPTQNLNIECAASGATISVNLTALDVPNRFTILDPNNNPVAQSSWLGTAAYPGSWGMTLNASSTGTLSFVKNSSGTYKIRVETQTPPNYSYSPTTDYWSATIGCECCTTCPSCLSCPAGYVCTNGTCVVCTTCPTCVSCPSGYICTNGACVPCTTCPCVNCPSGQTCVNGACQCSIPCGGTYSGTYQTINSYYIYPIQNFDVSCAQAGATITVNVTALDVPNKFTILDANNNLVRATRWLGTANYPGPWGQSLSASSTGTITFTKTTGATTYKIRVETQTPPDFTFSPTTDFWSATVGCPN